MISVDDTVVPFPLSAEAFLQRLFGDQWKRALIAAFPGDPDTEANWIAWQASMLPNPGKQDRLNLYYSPSLVTGKRRWLNDFVSFHVLVIDDYGTKVKAGEPEKLLGPPSFQIETSPANYQIGWVIDPPITDLGWLKGFLEKLRGTVGAGDNLTDPMIWRRLPAGINGKAKYLLEGWPWKVKGQHASVTLTQEQLGSAVGGVSPARTYAAADPDMPDPGEIEADLLLIGFRLAGRVLGTIRHRPMGWGYEVRCPWADEHSSREDEGAFYVPVYGRFKCHHGHCLDRDVGDVREKLGTLVDGGLAGLEFDEVPPASPFEAAGAREGPIEAVDLWLAKTPPAWPGEVLPGRIEDSLISASRMGGIDMGALGAVAMTVFSGVCDKRSVFVPYRGVPWQVRAILWTMLVGETGMKKTAILYIMLARIRRLHTTRMKAWAAAMSAWKKIPARERGPQPEVEALLAEDTTVEKLQEYMASQPRGMLYLRDELAGMFDFGRYSSSAGAAERAFFLESNEGGPTTVSRISRLAVIDNSALALLGGAQPQRLARFPDLAEDGMLSRLATVIMQHGDKAVRDGSEFDGSAIDASIDRLLANGVFEDYVTDATGEALIEATQAFGESLSERPDIPLGMRGFLRKLHGVQARTALLLHLVDGGDAAVIPAVTVERAGRYARFLYGHADVFYAGLPGSADEVARAIGSFILRHPGMEKLTAGQIRRDIAACRGLKSLREIQDAVFVLVIGGWLSPETHWPSNKVWLIRPGLEIQFATRVVLETERVERIKHDMNWLGKTR